MNADELKLAAAKQALGLVESGMRIGLGTGSTSSHFVRELGQSLKRGDLKNIVGVPTSESTTQLAQEYGIVLEDWRQELPLDFAVDGADEIDPRLNLIKGLGGALLREKAVERRARRLVIVADESKLVQTLGQKCPLPVEVSFKNIEQFVEEFAHASPKLRRGNDGQNFSSDNGNAIIDLFCGPIGDVQEFAKALERSPLVEEHGLFLDMASRAIVASPSGIRNITPPPRQSPGKMQ